MVNLSMKGNVKEGSEKNAREINLIKDNIITFENFVEMYRKL